MTSLVIAQELEAITTNTNSANLSSEQILATEIDTTTWNSRADTVDHPEVPGLGTVGPAMVSTVHPEAFVLSLYTVFPTNY